MKTLTPKQRAKIYRKAAENVLTLKECCCWGIKNSCEKIARDANTIEIMWAFPEFALFNPTGDKIGYWWETYEDTEPRILALLLSAEMAENPIYK